MVYADHFDARASDTIWDEIWCLRDHQFTRTGDTARSTHGGLGWKKRFDNIDNPLHPAGGSSGIILGNVLPECHQILDSIR